MTDQKHSRKDGSWLKIGKSSPLSGACAISTSKNAVLPILAAALLTKETITIRRLPRISDVQHMICLLRAFGADISLSGDTLVVTARSIRTTSPNEYLVRRLRASFLFMGPLLAREGCVTMPLPGGCRIGLRPIDLHIKGFGALGAKTITASGNVITWGKKLTGGTIFLEYPSVGATENILMASCLAEGKTTIIGAATEPEILDLMGFLRAMGADIRMTGRNRIVVIGKETLHGADYSPIADRIEAGTLMLAAAVSYGDVRLERANIRHLGPICSKLAEAGTEIFPYAGGVHIKGRGIHPMNIVSEPYPGFPTDLQAPFLAACCVANGTSTINETVFENRFLHVAELRKMGAHIDVAGNTAVVMGMGRLCGADVCATDLRAGAALCIAGLVAGNTTIRDIYHLDRGYEDFTGKLKKLGADISRLS